MCLIPKARLSLTAFINTYDCTIHLTYFKPFIFYTYPLSNDKNVKSITIETSIKKLFYDKAIVKIQQEEKINSEKDEEMEEGDINLKK